MEVSFHISSNNGTLFNGEETLFNSGFNRILRFNNFIPFGNIELIAALVIANVVLWLISRLWSSAGNAAVSVQIPHLVVHGLSHFSDQYYQSFTKYLRQTLVFM